MGASYISEDPANRRKSIIWVKATYFGPLRGKYTMEKQKQASKGNVTKMNKNSEI